MGDWWVPYASLVTAVVAIVVAMLVKSPVVPRSRMVDLAGQVTSLKVTVEGQSRQIEQQSRQIERQTSEIAMLTSKLAARDARIDALMDECEFWREKFRAADEKQRNPRPPRT